MNRFWKILAGIVAFLVAVILALNIYLSDDRVKSYLIPMVENATGRQPEVASVSLTFFRTFPHPGVSIEQMHLPGESESDTLAALERLAVGIHLSSLFSGDITLSELDLEGLRFTYRVNPDGSTNLDFLTSETGDDSTGDGYAFHIPYFQIRDTRLGYEDPANGTAVSFHDLNGNISLGFEEQLRSTVDLTSGGMDLAVNGSQFFTGLPVSLSETSTIDTGNEVLTLEEGTFSVRALSLKLQGTVRNWSDAPELNLEIRSSSDDFNNLFQLAPEHYRNRLEDFETGGSLAIEGTVEGTYGEDNLPSYAFQTSVQNGRIKYPGLPGTVENIELELTADNNSIRLTSLDAEAGPNTLSAAGTLRNPLANDNRTVDLETDLRLDLSSIKNFYPIDEDTLEMRGMLEARAKLKGSLDRLEEAVEQGSVVLKDGYIDYKGLKKPFRNISVESIAKGDRITIVSSGFESGGNRLELSGTVTDYLGNDMDVNLWLKGSVAITELTDYYDPGPAISSLSGDATMDLRVEGSIDTPAEMNLNGSLGVSNLNMDGPDSLGLIQPVENLNGKLALSPTEMILENLDFKLGSSDIHLDGTLEGYMLYLSDKENRTTTPRLTGSYRSRYLNLDELIDWEDTTGSEAETPIHLPDLNSSISASVEEMLVTGVTMRNLEARARTTPVTIELEKATVELFEGTASGTFVWNVPEPSRTVIRFQGSLDSLRLEQFFREYPVLGPNSDFHKYATGTFSTDVTYHTELDSYLNPVIETTRMEGSFGMTESRMEGHPVQNKIADFLNTGELKSLVLDRWRSTFSVSNSTLSIDSLRLTSGEIGGELSGTRHLIKSTVDYRVKVYLPGRFKKAIASVITQQAANALTQENGTIMVPLRITGTAENPKIAPDREVIKPIIEKYLKEKAGSVLDKLFKGDR